MLACNAMSNLSTSCTSTDSALLEQNIHSKAHCILCAEVDKLDMALQASIYAKEGTSSFQNLQVFFDSAKKSINNTEVKSMLDLFLKKLT